MKKLLLKLWNYIPKYVIVPLIFVFTYQNIVYFLTKLINQFLPHHTLITKYDSMIPLIPSFSIIYLGCYLFWVWNYMLVGKTTKEHFYKFITCIFVSYTLCAMTFVIYPTVIDRPEVTVNSFSTFLLHYIFASDTPNNLFPSMHCLVSWLCYLGIKSKPQIPRWYQITSLCIAILVCISTVTVKQHYIVDIFAGVLLAELIYYLTQHVALWKYTYRFFESINKKLSIK